MTGFRFKRRAFKAIAAGAPALMLAALADLPAARAQQFPGLVVTTPPSAPQQGSMPGLVVSSPPAPQGPPPGMPGLVVSAPPAQGRPPIPLPGGGQPGAVPPAQQQAKPKPAPKPKKVASTDKSAGVPVKGGPLGIAALVNDEPVTAFEVESLAQFMVLSTNISDKARANLKAIAENPATNERLKAILQETIQQNQGKTREQIIAIFEERKKQFVMGIQKQALDGARSSTIPGLRKKALEELVDSRLKFQEAKKMSITIGEDEAERAMKGIADRNKISLAEFTENIRKQGADPNVMKSRLHAQLVWREVVRRRYGHQINVSNREIDSLVANTKDQGDQVELGLHKVTFATTGKIDQKLLAQRVDDAERFRAKFAGCKGLAAMTKDLANARHEDLGFKKVSTLAEPLRSLALSAGDGDTIPVPLSASGAEVYVVCGRRVAKANDEKRQAAESELQMKEFERIATRFLQDLRKDALVEIKQQ